MVADVAGSESVDQTNPPIVNGFSKYIGLEFMVFLFMLSYPT